MFDEVFAREQEYRVLAMDGTMKVCMGLRGQTRPGRTSNSSSPSALEPEEQVRRVLTVRGCTGALLGLEMIQEETPQEVIPALRAVVPPAMRGQVLFVCTDAPSQEMWSSLKTLCPQLVAMCLDTEHLLMKYKSANGNHPSPGSRMLSRIMAKFNVGVSSASSEHAIQPYPSHANVEIEPDEAPGVCMCVF